MWGRFIVARHLFYECLQYLKYQNRHAFSILIFKKIDSTAYP